MILICMDQAQANATQWLLTLLKPKKNGQLDAMAAALVGIIVNVSPYVFNLGRATSLKMIQLVDLYTRNSLSTSVEVNAMVLTHIVRAVNSMLEEHKPGNGRWQRSLSVKNMLIFYSQRTRI